jgi:hypothetical protein
MLILLYYRLKLGQQNSIAADSPDKRINGWRMVRYLTNVM